MAKQAQAAEVRSVTFTPEALQAVVAQAIAEHEAKKAIAKKAEATDKYTALTVSAFKRAGFKVDDIKPRENVLTFNKWLEKGFRPREGARAVAVKNLRLFHVSQVRPLSAEDADMVAAKAAKGVPVAMPAKPAKASAKPAKGHHPQPAA